MNNMKEQDNNRNKIIKDVPRMANDIYRISSWSGKEGKSFLDVRVFFKKDGKFKRTKEGLNILAELGGDVAAAILAAKNAPEIPAPAEGKKCESKLVSSVPISETAEYQVSKVRGPKNKSVRICYAFKGEEGNFIPSGKKAISILESSVEGVAEAFWSPEAVSANGEAAA